MDGDGVLTDRGHIGLCVDKCSLKESIEFHHLSLKLREIVPLWV